MFRCHCRHTVETGRGRRDIENLVADSNADTLRGSRRRAIGAEGKVLYRKFCIRCIRAGNEALPRRIVGFVKLDCHFRTGNAKSRRRASAVDLQFAPALVVAKPPLGLRIDGAGKFGMMRHNSAKIRQIENQ